MNRCSASVCVLLMASTWCMTPVPAQQPAPFDIPRLESIRIDGDLSDWGEHGYRIESLNWEGPPAAPDDYDPKFRIGWSEEGLLVGGSAGMAVVSALKYAREHELDANQTVIVLLPDSGRSYMEKIFNDDWMRANGFADVVERTTKPSLAEQYL